MTEQTAHYECPVTGEVLPDDEMIEVGVFKLEKRRLGTPTDGPNRAGSVRIDAHLLHSSTVGAQVLLAKGEPIARYRHTDQTSRMKLVDNMSDEEAYTWEQVVEAVLE